MVTADVNSEHSIHKAEEHKDWNKYKAPKNPVQFHSLLKSHWITKLLRLRSDSDLYSVILRNFNKYVLLELTADSNFASEKTVPHSTCKSLGCLGKRLHNLHVMNFTIYIQTPKQYNSVTATNCSIHLYYVKLRLYNVVGNDFEPGKNLKTYKCLATLNHIPCRFCRLKLSRLAKCKKVRKRKPINPQLRFMYHCKGKGKIIIIQTLYRT
jgi:hypothetical protein